MDEGMCRLLRAGAELKHWKNLRERINSQPQPQHLLMVAQSGAQFVQLEVWEVQIAESKLMQGLSVLASASQPRSDGGLSVAEDTFGSGSIQAFGKRRQHH